MGDFNSILAKTRHWTDQTCRLTKDGAAIPTDSYCDESKKRDRIGLGRPDYERLGAALREGAALHLERMESLRPQLATMTANLRALFCVPLAARLTFSRKSQPLSETRFETSDLMLLQSEGECMVRLFDGAFEHPVELPGFNIDTLSTRQATEICGELVAELPMTPGDLLYLPAGQFYDLMSGDGPAMQLVYALQRPSGLDFAAFLFRKLLDDPLFRADLPFFDDASALERHTEKMAQRLAENVTSRNLAEAYRDDRLTRSVLSPLAPLGLPQPMASPATAGATRHIRSNAMATTGVSSARTAATPSART